MTLDTKNKSTLHESVGSLVYTDDVLTWAGRNVNELADELGSTPFYVYDRNHMTQRVAEFRKIMPEKLSLHYAMKANPMPEVVKHMASVVDGLDVASGGELSVALKTSIDAKDISFAGPGKRDAELKSAIESNVTINVESETEMRRIASFGDSLGIRPHVAIRVNPMYEIRTAGMKMGGRPSQFGIDAERVPAAIAELATYDIDFRGFHVFSGSQNLRADTIVESLEKTTDLVIELAATSRTPISYVNLGGGIGIPYFPGDKRVDLNLIAPAFHSAIERFSAALGQVEPIIELGRYLVGESGIFVSRIIDIKISRGTKFVICDGGLNNHLAASGNFGQVIRKNYPVVAVNHSEKSELVTVVGPLCTPLDLLGNKMLLQDLSVGALIAILQSGAYGASSSPSSFLSHPACKEILVG